MIRPQIALALVLVLAAPGCATVADVIAPVREVEVAPLQPIYELSDLTLGAKADLLFQRILDDHLNAEGYLLYAVPLPLGQNYQIAHNSADMPAWHGDWMASLAFRQAVRGDVADLILASLNGLRTNFTATGVPGLLGRAYLRSDRRLPWMATEDEKPTRFWQQGEDGWFYRNGVAKGHYGGAIFGLAAVIGLEARGLIELEPETRELAHHTVVAIAHHLIHGGYRIREADGRPTEFGNLSDLTTGNGFSALQVLTMLRAAAAAGDKLSASEYTRLQSEGARDSIRSLVALGNLYARVGRHRFGHWGDDMAIFRNAFALWLVASPEDQELLEQVQAALRTLWRYVRFSPNAYAKVIYQIVVERQEHELGQALETLRQFPDDKRVISPLGTEKGEQIQPVPNQRINSNYWKTNYFKRAIRLTDSHRTKFEHSGQDYLVVYWMARAFGLL